jgi:bifunctional DNase/RNase
VKGIISALKDDIFFGTLIIEKDGKEIKVDSRPSDAIAIAVRAHVPVMVSPKVMDEASIIPEEISESQEESTLTDEDAEVEKSGGSAKAPSRDDRLSIFEDYFKNKPDESSDEQEKSDEDPEDTK